MDYVDGGTLEDFLANQTKFIGTLSFIAKQNVDELSGWNLYFKFAEQVSKMVLCKVNNLDMRCYETSS